MLFNLWIIKTWKIRIVSKQGRRWISSVVLVNPRGKSLALALTPFRGKSLAPALVPLRGKLTASALALTPLRGKSLAPALIPPRGKSTPQSAGYQSQRLKCHFSSTNSKHLLLQPRKAVFYLQKFKREIDVPRKLQELLSEIVCFEFKSFNLLKIFQKPLR